MYLGGYVVYNYWTFLSGSSIEHLHYTHTILALSLSILFLNCPEESK